MRGTPYQSPFGSRATQGSFAFHISSASTTAAVDFPALRWPKMPIDSATASSGSARSGEMRRVAGIASGHE